MITADETVIASKMLLSCDCNCGF